MLSLYLVVALAVGYAIRFKAVLFVSLHMLMFRLCYLLFRVDTLLIVVCYAFYEFFQVRHAYGGMHGRLCSLLLIAAALGKFTAHLSAELVDKYAKRRAISDRTNFVSLFVPLLWLEIIIGRVVPLSAASYFLSDEFHNSFDPKAIIVNTPSNAATHHGYHGNDVAALISSAFLLVLFNLTTFVNRYFYSYCRERLDYLELARRLGRPILTTFRPQFRDWEPLYAKPGRNHTHPKAAALRTSVDTSINMFITQYGKRPFSIKLTERDIQNGIPGAHDYTLKTMNLWQRASKPRPDDFIKSIDADYTYNFNQLDGRPMIMYTFVPTKVAGPVPDGVFTIDESDNVVMTISPSTTYKHQLWDYSSDHVVLESNGHDYLYLTEHKSTPDPDRQIILLQPVFEVPKFIKYVAPPPQALKFKRQKFNHGGVNSLRVLHRRSGEMLATVSVGLPMSYVSVDYPDVAFETATMRCQLSKYPSTADVERIFQSVNYKDEFKDPKHAATLFMTALPDLSVSKSPPITVMDYHTYQTTHPLITEDGAVTMVQLCEPILPGAVAPARSMNNDTACISGRLDKPRNNVVPPLHYASWATEFAQLVVPQYHLGYCAPGDFDEVFEKQSRPSQINILERARHFSFVLRFLAVAFQKVEAYMKVHFPRNITTVPADHKFRFSTYTYAFGTYFKQFDWYAFGKHPRKFTKRLRKLCNQHNQLIPSDFTTFDGSVGKIHDDVVKLIFLRLTPPEYQAELTSLLKQQRYARGVTAHDLWYNTGTTTLSGSPDTSLRNTIINAFMSYCALRHVNYSPEQAYANLGVYGGDDGISVCVTSEELMAVHKATGLISKLEVCDKGSPVKFLGRIYLNPWTCDDSIGDVNRLLSRAHLGPKSSVSRDLLLTRRAQGLLTTDPNTPLLKHWCRAVLRRHKSVQPSEYCGPDVSPWFSQYAAPFELDLSNLERATDIICDELGIDQNTLERAIMNCKAVGRDPGAEFVTIMERETPVMVQAAIGGILVDPPTPATAEPAVAKALTYEDGAGALQPAPVCDDIYARGSPPAPRRAEPPKIEGFRGGRQPFIGPKNKPKSKRGSAVKRTTFETQLVEVLTDLKQGPVAFPSHSHDPKLITEPKLPVFGPPNRPTEKKRGPRPRNNNRPSKQRREDGSAPHDGPRKSKRRRKPRKPALAGSPQNNREKVVPRPADSMSRTGGKPPDTQGAERG
jgi:hypothetical protein